MDTHIETIRENVRQLASRDRKVQRDIVLNRQRGTLQFKDNPELTPDITVGIAKKIKSKGGCTVNEYSLINQALIQSAENVDVFFKIYGALHGIVRDLTGQNAALQLQAANCCCNLSLGNEKQCTMVTKSAAPYLISYLDGLNIPLMDVSAWTLGNLAGGGAKPWHILKSQGLLPKLLNHVNLSSALLKPAVYAVTHYVHTGITEKVINEETLFNITHYVDALLKAEPHGYWLLYLLTCSPACLTQLLQMPLIDNLLQVLATENNISSITSITRTLGNLCAEQKGAAQFLQNMDTIKTMQIILSVPQCYLHKEVLWLLGNVTNNAPPELQPYLLDLYSRLQNELNRIISENAPV